MADEQGIGGGFRHVLDAISDGVYVTGPDRTIVYWSAGAERISGYSEAEVIGRRCDENLLGHTHLEGARICLSGCPLQDCEVNDRLGPLTGDEAIKFVADVLSESVREMDVAADDPDERAVLGRADGAMYAAKKRGRNDFAVAGNGGRR